MRWTASACLFVAAAALSGCVPIPSLYGVVDGPGTPCPEVVGQWRDPADSTNTIRFVRDSTGACTFTLPRSEVPDVRFAIRFERLGGRTFGDLVVNLATLTGGDDLSPFVLPAHLFARMEVKGDTLRMGLLDDEWVEREVRAHRVRARLEKPDGDRVLAEGPEGLRRLLAHAAPDDDAFIVLEFVRER